MSWRSRLADHQVLGTTVGLRPFRRGSARMEVERLGSKLLAHNYGHGGSGITVCWGAAEHVVGQLGLERSTEIAVLGAGALGLCTATLLAQHGHQITLYAAEFPPHTTSNIAGGLWAPTHMAVGSSDAEKECHRRILEYSWNYFESQLDGPFGVSRVKLYEAANSPHPLDPMPAWLTGPGENMTSFPFGADSPGGVVWSTFLVETPVFLARLVEDLKAAGAGFRESHFESLSQVLELPQNVIVNCLGLGAGELLGDRAMVPIRGQLVHLNPIGQRLILDHASGYIISRDDQLVLGGTFDEGVADTTPCQQSTQEILAGNRAFFGLPSSF